MGRLLKQKQIIAVGSGKGGVGKSYVACNIGLALAQSQKRTILVDADLGGANLHTCLGMAKPEATLSDYMSNHGHAIDTVIAPTQYAGLSLISGAHDILDITDASDTQSYRLIEALQDVEAEYIVLDLGAGTTKSTLDFFLAADKGVVVLIPEPTSIENAYRFIKGALYRKLRQLSINPRVRMVIEQATDSRNHLNLRSPLDLIDFICRMEPEIGENMVTALSEFRPQIILNQVRSVKDVKVGYAIQNACSKFFGLALDFIGFLEADDQVWRSVRQRTPVLASSKKGKSARNLRVITQNLVYNQQLGNMNSMFSEV